jgi:ABC-type transport system involved in multi-copper enzyme maturation permease subunit
MEARSQALKMWIVTNVATFFSQMALVVILCSFGKKSEKSKEADPEQPVPNPQNLNTIAKITEDDDFAESSHMSYTLLDTYKNSTSSINQEDLDLNFQLGSKSERFSEI